MSVRGKKIDFSTADDARYAAAREGYIRWRMGDVPAVYLAMVPLSCCARELWIAERHIRQQMADDARMTAQPWRRIGEKCSLLDLSGLTTEESLEFGLEAAIPAFCKDAPKSGRENDPEVVAQIQRWKDESPAYAQRENYALACRDLEHAIKVYKAALESEADAQHVEDLRAVMVESQRIVGEFTTKYPELAVVSMNPADAVDLRGK